MKVKFEEPMSKLRARSFSESKIKKDPQGRKYLKLVKNLIDSKLVKFKSVPKLLKEVAESQQYYGTCFGQATEILKKVKSKGAIKGLPEEISKTKVVTTTHIHNLDVWLTGISEMIKNGKKKKLKKASHIISELSGIEPKNVDVKKVDKCLKKVRKFADKSEINLDVIEEGKTISFKETKKIVQYVEKKLNKAEDENVLLSIGFCAKKDVGHMIAAGKDKNEKPFLYDAQRGYARFKDTSELVKLLKKDYFSKHGKYNDGYSSVSILAK